MCFLLDTKESNGKAFATWLCNNTTLNQFLISYFLIWSLSFTFVPWSLSVFISHFPSQAKNEASQRGGVFKYVCQCMVWANCTQFQKKEGLLSWVERALTALPFTAGLSFILTHKGCVMGRGWVQSRGVGGTICLRSHREGSRRIGMCFRPHDLSWGSAPSAPSNFTAWESSRAGAPLLLAAATRRRVTLSGSASPAFFLKCVFSLCLVLKTHTQILQRGTPCAAEFGLNRYAWRSCARTIDANWVSLAAKLPTEQIVCGSAAAWHHMPPAGRELMKLGLA